MINPTSKEIFSFKETNPNQVVANRLFPRTKIFHAPFAAVVSFCNAEMLVNSLRVSRVFGQRVTAELQRRFAIVERLDDGSLAKQYNTSLQLVILMKGVNNHKVTFYHEVAILSLWKMRQEGQEAPLNPVASTYLLSLAHNTNCLSKVLFKGIFAKSDLTECNPLLLAVRWNNLFLATVAVEYGVQPTRLIHTEEFVGYPHEQLYTLPASSQAHFRRLFDKHAKLQERRDLARLKAAPRAKVVKKTDKVAQPLLKERMDVKGRKENNPPRAPLSAVTAKVNAQNGAAVNVMGIAWHKEKNAGNKKPLAAAQVKSPG